MARNYLFLLAFFTLISCENQTSYLQEAENVTESFYRSMQKDNLDSVLNLFGDDFYKTIDTTTFINKLAEIKSNFGTIDRAELEKTNVSNKFHNGNSSQEIIVTYQVTYSLGMKATEQFVLNVDNEIVNKIANYSIKEN